MTKINLDESTELIKHLVVTTKDGTVEQVYASKLDLLREALPILNDILEEDDNTNYEMNEVGSFLSQLNNLLNTKE